MTVKWLVDLVVGCRHRHLGVWFRRGGQDWQTCTLCGVAVLAKVQTGPDQYIRPPVRTQDAKPAQAEEPQPTGLERAWLKEMGVRG